MYSLNYLPGSRKLVLLLAGFLCFSLKINALATYTCSPKIVNIESNFGMASLCLMGEKAAAVTSLTLYKDGKVQNDFLAQPAYKNTKTDAMLSVEIFIVKASLPLGHYTLQGIIGGATVTLPVDIVVVSCPENKKSNLTLAPNIALNGFGSANVYKAIGINNKPSAGYESGVGLAVTSEAMRRNLMLDALNSAISAVTPNVKDWLPKSMGACDGTLVLAGEKMDKVTEVRIGATVLEILSTTAQAGTGAQVSTLVLKLPSTPLQGNLEVKGQTNIFSLIEANYRTVNQNDAQWPKPRATYIGAANVYVGDALTPGLNEGHADAMRLAQYSFLVEYVPGNILKSAVFRDSVPKLRNKAGEKVAAFGAYTFQDASGNNGFYGNAIVVTFQKYVNDQTTTSALSVLTCPFTIQTQSYTNTASAQNNIYKCSPELTLEYNSLKKYVINNTTELSRLFTFYNTRAWGQVSDISTNFDGSNSIPVGPIRDGGDFAFRIASGPFGTAGAWQSNAFKMPHGWFADNVTWSEKRDYNSENVMAYSGNSGYTDLADYANMISQIGNGFTICGGKGTYYLPGLGKYSFASRWTASGQVKSITATGKMIDFLSGSALNHSLSFGIKPLQLNTGTAVICALGPPLNGLETTMGQFVCGVAVMLESDGNMDNSVRVLFKMENMTFIGPHNGVFTDMLNSIYIYNSGTLTGNYNRVVGSMPPYPPTQMERYTAIPVSYYMDEMRQ